MIEMFEPLEARIVVNPAIRGRFDYPITRNMTARIPGGEVESARDAEERRHHMAIRYNTTNRRSPFSIPRLDCLRFADSF